MLRGRLGLGLVLAVSTMPGGNGLAAGAGQYLVNDYGTPALVRNILPSGQAGTVTATDAVQNRMAPPYHPDHLFDQRAMYDGTTLTAPNSLTQAQFLQFTKPATFGVPDDDIGSVESPKAGLTIIRDKSFGVPHIFATSKALAEFGSGWVSAQDRLFMMDVLRHAGRGNLASLIGSSAYEMDCGTHYDSGYDAADAALQRQDLEAHHPELVKDGQDFADGVNAWIQSPGFLQHMPVEYAAFPMPVGPNAWTQADIGAVAVLIGSQLGGGGGAEIANTLAYEKLVKTYGASEARRIFDDLHAADDPESPTTIDTAFPYESRAGRSDASVALIDSYPSDPQGCTSTRVPPSGTPAAAAPGSDAARAFGEQSAQRALASLRSLRLGHHASNALVIGPQASADGHPLAVFGSQAAYWVPEIWMEMDIHAPDLDARGFQFPGTGIIVEIGRGRNFAWSATSAGSDNVDNRVERLCNPSAADPLKNVDPNSTNYFYKGRCLPMVEKTVQYPVPLSAGTTGTDAWTGLETFHIERTVHDDGIGIVQGRTTATLADGTKVPVAVSRQRTNFFHELDQADGFVDWNTPSKTHDAKSFIAAAAKVDTTFNWFYVDSSSAAYFSSGRLPLRNPAADPDLLNWATGEWDWQGILPPAMHPQAINPSRGWMTSWNNRPAPHFGASDSNWDYGPLYRNQMLDRGIESHLAKGKLSLLDVFNSMQVASVTDLRAQRLIDNLMRVIGPLSPAEQAKYGSALAAVGAWHAAGDRRQANDGHGHETSVYANADGIAIFDAWSPHVVHAIFDPWLGATPDHACNDDSTRMGGIPKTWDNPPNDAHCYPGDWSGYNVGSAYDGGWQDAVDKALRMVLGQPVRGPYSAIYCGGSAPASAGAAPVQGSAVTCRARLLHALDRALEPPPPNGQGHMTDYAALTALDRIEYRPLGLQGLPSSPWSNKPTQQQFIEFLRGADGAETGVTNALPDTARAATPLLLVAVVLALLAWRPRRRSRSQLR